MIKGRVVCAGDICVDGTMITGLFVECSLSDLRDNKNLVYSDVEVNHAEKENNG